MKTTPLNPLYFVLLLTAGLLTTGMAQGSEQKDSRPNLLLIITDQQFAEAMSCRMGNEVIHTPAMDRLAQRGISFTRAYSSNPLCVPLRTALMTGRYPHETGISQNKDNGSYVDKFKCMGNYFRDGGYAAAYSGKWHVAFSQKQSGFETLHGSKAPGGYDIGVADGAINFLSRPHDKPFLLVASFLNPHNICQWARRLAGKEQTLNCGEVGEPPPLDQLPPAPDNLAPQRNEPDGITLMRKAIQAEGGKFPVGNFSEEDWRKLRWGYYRMMELVDQEIGRVLDALKDAGLEDNTVIVFMSDHGECAGAHGWNQKTVFYEESARVPLIIAAPGMPHSGSARQLANTGLDVLPTLLDFAHLKIPEQLPGRSLAPVVLGAPVDGWRKYVVSENNLNQARPLNGITPQMEGRMVRSERYKYCVYNRGIHRESLVDLQTDPGEMINLARDPEHRGVLLQHRDMLAEFGRKHSDPLVEELLADDVKPIPFPEHKPSDGSGNK